jgi:hypothetical protein
MIVVVSYCALNEIKVVIVPVPAISGNAIGTIEAVSGISSRYKRIPKIISRARKKITKEPAIAKEETSIPINFRILSPRNKKSTIINKDAKVAFSA